MWTWEYRVKGKCFKKRGPRLGNEKTLFLDFDFEFGWGPVLIPWTAALIALGSSVLLGLVGGVYPALKASRLSPVEALNLS